MKAGKVTADWIKKIGTCAIQYFQEIAIACDKDLTRLGLRILLGLSWKVCTKIGTTVYVIDLKKRLCESLPSHFFPQLTCGTEKRQLRKSK